MHVKADYQILCTQKHTLVHTNVFNKLLPLKNSLAFFWTAAFYWSCLSTALVNFTNDIDVKSRSMIKYTQLSDHGHGPMSDTVDNYYWLALWYNYEWHQAASQWLRTRGLSGIVDYFGLRYDIWVTLDGFTVITDTRLEWYRGLLTCAIVLWVTPDGFTVITDTWLEWYRGLLLACAIIYEWSDTRWLYIDHGHVARVDVGFVYYNYWSWECTNVEIASNWDFNTY